MIKGIEYADIFDDLKRNDHIVFSLNTIGVHPSGAGYGAIEQIVERFCAEYKDVGQNPYGTIITHEVPEHHLWFHGIVNHDIEKGWEHDEESVYQVTQDALDRLAAEWEDEETFVRPMRSLWLGRGKMRRHGKTEGNINWMLQAMANSKLELVVYVLDGWDW